jgi:VIT1/CCC1 family predicted Fe2+/Mn2+ transporter
MEILILFAKNALAPLAVICGLALVLRQDDAETAELKEQSSRVLNPVERWSEILFGLIMTLSFTCTLSVVAGGREEVVTMMVSVLGCNVAWGIIDGVLYVIGSVSERGRSLRLFKALRVARNAGAARAIIAEAIPPTVASVMNDADFDSLRQRLANLPDPPERVRMNADDLKSAVAVFLFVLLSCIPVIIPFVLIHEPKPALRASNGVAIAMLFVGGYLLARYSGFPKIPTGITMVVLGLLMVGLTIALGG